MVSPLSSRIYNLEAKAKIKNLKPSLTNDSKLPWQIENRRKRISGYIADKESESVVVNTQKQHRAEQVESLAKRRKVEQQNFKAHNVKNELAAAGIDFVPRSRAFPEGSIDMSCVELITSSKFDARCSKAPSNLERSPFETMQDCAALFEMAKPHYKYGKNGRKVSKTVTSANSSSTICTSLSSSPCESDLEDNVFVSPEEYELPGLEEKVQVYKNSGAFSEFLSSSTINVMNIDQALNFCNYPRLIIESKAPYKIVHSNAAFSNFSSISSENLAGTCFTKYLGQIVEPKTLEILQMDKTQKRNKVFIMCNVDVFEVTRYNSEQEERMGHFVLEFQKYVETESDSLRQDNSATYVTG